MTTQKSIDVTEQKRLNDAREAGIETVYQTLALSPALSIADNMFLGREIRSKGVIAFSDTKLVDYETFKRAQDEQLMALAWLWNMNRGIFATPGREEEWTLSIRMTDDDVDLYVSTFAELVDALTR